MHLSLITIVLFCFVTTNSFAAEIILKNKTIKVVGKQDLIGTWRNGNKVVEFSPDNQYILSYTDSLTRFTLKYKMVKNNVFSLTGNTENSQYNNARFMFYMDGKILSISAMPIGSSRKYVRLDASEINKIKQFKMTIQRKKADKKSKRLAEIEVRAEKLGCKISGKTKISEVERRHQVYEFKCQDKAVILECNRYTGSSMTCYDISP